MKFRVLYFLLILLFDSSLKIYMLYLTGMQDGRSPLIDLRPALVITMSGPVFDQIYLRQTWVLKGLLSVGLLAIGVFAPKIDIYLRFIFLTLGGVLFSNQLDLIFRDFYINIFHFAWLGGFELSGGDLWLILAIVLIMPAALIYNKLARR